ncbi:Rne/Rng family ribonuclease [Rothia sp. ZJ1223]|uniref:Rne/Rng family ribonuclease n=1 Tax=Rothia sp. ZJ1223 TaxID=2811098 RepID=UPI001958DB3A|nr:Rne/Rng family ribonuclease [Rothia sp. ZJ1223]MBM7050432.1 Rne/Rng family ribonuclease [Rothia sp. ZJ1223]
MSENNFEVVDNATAAEDSADEQITGGINPVSSDEANQGAERKKSGKHAQSTESAVAESAVASEDAPAKRTRRRTRKNSEAQPVTEASNTDSASTATEQKEAPLNQTAENKVDEAPSTFRVQEVAEDTEESKAEDSQADATPDVAEKTADQGEEKATQQEKAEQKPAPKLVVDASNPENAHASELAELINETEAAETQAEKTQREIQAEKLAELTRAAASSLLFHEPEIDEVLEKARAERKARQEKLEAERRARRAQELAGEAEVTSRRRRRRRRGEEDMEIDGGSTDDPENTVTKVRAPRVADSHTGGNRVAGVRGSTRLEAKRQRRRESRATGRRRHIITEAEFLARRESVDRQMIVRQKDDRIQIGVLEDGVLAEHFVSKTQQDSLIGNVYLGKVQNVLPSMEAAFVDIGRGRNAVLYAGEVNWDVSGLDGAPRKIENALKAGDSVLVQVTKDPVGHKGARLTSQVSLPGRYLVYVPGGSMTGISRKLPDVERARLKKILKDKLPDGAGVIVRTAAEGASEEELTNDINRLRVQWEEIQSKSTSNKVLAPEMLYQEPDLTIKTVRDVFNEDFTSMVVQGDHAWDSIEAYVTYVAPDLLDRLQRWDNEKDLFDHYRVEEQLHKALDRKVYLPSGGSLVIDRTEAMTVVDVNTGKFTGSGGNLEETVTKNNLEAAEEIVRQLRLRDIGGIIVIDFIDMVLESNRDLVLRRLVECLGRDRTKHQVAEVTSLGLVQMTRKRMGTGLLEVFSESCEACAGRGLLVHDQPLKGRVGGASDFMHRYDRFDREDRKRFRNQKAQQHRQNHETEQEHGDPQDQQRSQSRKAALATIAAASLAHEEENAEQESKSVRKRKRRKNNRRTDSDAPASENEIVVTLGDEVIELPQGHKNDDDEVEGEQGAFTLESLAQVFEGKGEKPRKKERREVDAEKLNENSDASADVDLDDRFTQNSERFEAIRAGEARARASQKAGRLADNAREGGRPDRSEREGNSNRGEGRKRRNRRASSDAVKYVQPQDAPVVTGVTGVATPGAAGEVAEPPVETSTQAAVQAEIAPTATKPKRRSRRAVSAGAGSQVKTDVVAQAQGVSVITEKVEFAPATEAEAPVMLGVGVAADEIKREGK